MTSQKSCFLWGNQGRSCRRGNKQAEEEERNSHEKSEEKGTSGRGNLMCKSLAWERIWHVERGQCGENGGR